MGLSREEVESIAQATAQRVVESLHRYAMSYQIPITIVGGLRDSMVEESTAANWYRRRAVDAKAQGDTATAELYEHIAKEEDQHYQEFQERAKALKDEITPVTPEVTEREARYGFLQLNEAEYNEAVVSGRYPEPGHYEKLTKYYTEKHEPGWKGISLAEMFPTKYKDLLSRGVPDKLSPLEVKTVIEEKRIPYGRGVELSKATPVSMAGK
jgi:rubrerythrin